MAEEVSRIKNKQGKEWNTKYQKTNSNYCSRIVSYPVLRSIEMQKILWKRMQKRRQNKWE